MPTVDLQTIYQARQRIQAVIRRTPLIYAADLSTRCEANVYLKLENQQETGSFKVRGAANYLLQLSAEARTRGVLTISTGNHGRAVAHVARQLGLRAVICVPKLVLAHKVAAMQALGAEVRIVGENQDETEAIAQAMAAQEGLTLISPFDDPAIIAGQGTIALEILEELPAVETVIVPLSGGGLMGGIGLAMKATSPRIRTIGVSMARGPVMVASLAAGQPVQLPEDRTLADSLMGGIGLDNRHSFQLIQTVVDATVLLDEAEIGAAMVYALRQLHQVVEGGGSVALGALLQGKVAVAGQTVVAVVSGGNADVTMLMQLVAENMPQNMTENMTEK